MVWCASDGMGRYQRTGVALAAAALVAVSILPGGGPWWVCVVGWVGLATIAFGGRKPGHIPTSKPDLVAGVPVVTADRPASDPAEGALLAAADEPVPEQAAIDAPMLAATDDGEAVSTSDDQEPKVDVVGLRAAFDALGEGVWEWFPATGQMIFSRGWRDMLHCTESEVPNTLESWAERIHPEDWVRTLDDMESHLAGATEVYENEHRARCGDGTYIWVHDRGVVLTRDADGAPTHLLGVRTDISVRKEMEDQLWRQAVEISNVNEQLAEMAMTDVLTGLHNRRGLMRQAEKEIEKAVESVTRFSLLFLDVDFFKRVNDTYGHDAGDAVLTELGRRLRAFSQSFELVGRIGGEEFAALLPNADCVAGASAAEILRQSVADQPFGIPDGRTIVVTTSIGVTCSDGHESLSAILNRADKALYEAKGSGRNRVQVLCEDHAKADPADAAA